MGRKKAYGIFNKDAQKGEKLSKNKAETVLPDSLYIHSIYLPVLGLSIETLTYTNRTQQSPQFIWTNEKLK